MKLTTLTLSALALAATLFSCQKEPDLPQQSFAGLKAGNEFLFETFTPVKLNINLKQNWGKEKVRLDIFDAAPAEGSQQLYSEFLNAAGEARGNANIPAQLKEVYVQLTFPNGDVSGEYILVDDVLSATLTEPETNNSYVRTDTDQDGVKDPADLFPHNQQVSAEVNYPGNNNFATVAFEDSWPYQSDFDFNDYVVEYRHTLITNSMNEVSRIKISAKLLHKNAKSGFAFKLPIAKELIGNVEGNRVETIKSDPNGIESGVAAAVIHVFDGESQVDQEIELMVTLTQTLDLWDLKGADFNPFIYQLNNRGVETHLKGGSATLKANKEYFNTGDDNSTPQVTYQDQNGLPWALNVSGKWQVPYEGVDVVRSYPKISRWISSGGQLNQDWYK